MDWNWKSGGIHGISALPLPKIVGRKKELTSFYDNLSTILCQGQTFYDKNSWKLTVTNQVHSVSRYLQ